MLTDVDCLMQTPGWRRRARRGGGAWPHTLSDTRAASWLNAVSVTRADSRLKAQSVTQANSLFNAPLVTRAESWFDAPAGLATDRKQKL